PCSRCAASAGASASSVSTPCRRKRSPSREVIVRAGGRTNATGSRPPRQDEAGSTERQRHRGEGRSALRPSLEGERALVEQHGGAIERRSAGTRSRTQERRRDRAVYQVDEEAAARRRGDAHRERASGEAERSRVDDQSSVLQRRTAPERFQGD